MKNIKKIALLAFLICCIITPGRISAQVSLSDPSMTYFKPFNLSVDKEKVNYNLNNGKSFSGIKSISKNNGNVTNVSYIGTLRMSNGDRYITTPAGVSFDQNFNLGTGWYYLIKANNEVYHVQYQNGNCIVQLRYTGQYSIDNNSCINIPTTYYDGGGYTPSTSSGGSTSGGSNYSSSRTTCGGCKGTGRCQHCSGTGYKNNPRLGGGTYQCSLCHGRGSCVSCAGRGYVR